MCVCAGLQEAWNTEMNLTEIQWGVEVCVIVFMGVFAY